MDDVFGRLGRLATGHWPDTPTAHGHHGHIHTAVFVLLRFGSRRRVFAHGKRHGREDVPDRQERQTGSALCPTIRQRVHATRKLPVNGCRHTDGNARSQCRCSPTA